MFGITQQVPLSQQQAPQPLPFTQSTDLLAPGQAIKKFAAERSNPFQFKAKPSHHVGLFEDEDEFFAKRDAKIAKEQKKIEDKRVIEQKKQEKAEMDQIEKQKSELVKPKESVHLPIRKLLKGAIKFIEEGDRSGAIEGMDEDEQPEILRQLRKKLGSDKLTFKTKITTTADGQWPDTIGEIIEFLNPDITEEQEQALFKINEL